MQNSLIAMCFVRVLENHHPFRRIIARPCKNQKRMKNLVCCADFLIIRHLRCFWYFGMSSHLFDCLPFFGLSSCYSFLLIKNSTLFWTHKILSSLIELVSFVEIFFYHCRHLIVHIHLLSLNFQMTFIIIMLLSVLGHKISSNHKYRQEFLRFCATVLSSIL